MRVGRVRLIAIVVLSVVTAFVAAYGITRGLRGERHPVAVPPRPAVAAVLGSATAAPVAAAPAPPAPVPTPAGVARQVGALAHASAFGGRLLARVIDAATGTVLYDSHGATPAAPASTAKLMTAAAILGVHQPSYRFTTRVVNAGNGTIVFVGGGDPTLSAAKPGKPPIYPGAARISDLARADPRGQGARAAHRRRRLAVQRPVHLAVLGSVRHGDQLRRADHRRGRRRGPDRPATAYARSGTPDLAAGADLAAALGTPNLPVTRGQAPPAAKVVASVQSAPLAQILPRDAADLGQHHRRHPGPAGRGRPARARVVHRRHRGDPHCAGPLRRPRRRRDARRQRAVLGRPGQPGRAGRRCCG